jgi:hypothetical protein
MTKFLRRKHLCARYGEVSDRTIDRMIDSGRLPPPEFPFGNRIPAWRENVLDEHDRRVVAAGAKPATA